MFAIVVLSLYLKCTLCNKNDTVNVTRIKLLCSSTSRSLPSCIPRASRWFGTLWNVLGTCKKVDSVEYIFQKSSFQGSRFQDTSRHRFGSVLNCLESYWNRLRVFLKGFATLMAVLGVSPAGVGEDPWWLGGDVLDPLQVLERSTWLPYRDLKLRKVVFQWIVL